MSKSLYLRCEPGDIAERVLLTGDPARVAAILERFEDGKMIAQNREFLVATGRFQGQRLTAVSSGIGAPSAAIAVEELAQLGAQAIVRVGTMMGIDLPMGCFVLATGAARFEGTSLAYLDRAFPAVPDWTLAQCLYDRARAAHRDVRRGVSATYDAFYPHMAAALIGRGLPQLDALRRAGVIALDMETALLYVLGTVLRVSVAALCLVTNNADPFEIIEADARQAGEDDLIETACAALVDWSAS
jgi:uridine phosphorylase